MKDNLILQSRIKYFNGNEIDDEASGDNLENWEVSDKDVDDNDSDGNCL